MDYKTFMDSAKGAYSDFGRGIRRSRTADQIIIHFLCDWSVVGSNYRLAYNAVPERLLQEWTIAAQEFGISYDQYSTLRLKTGIENTCRSVLLESSAGRQSGMLIVVKLDGTTRVVKLVPCAGSGTSGSLSSQSSSSSTSG